MFRQDYIMRIIKVFVNALVKLIRLRREQNHEAARQMIEQTWEEIFGLPTSSIMALSERTLLSMLLKQDTQTIDTALMVAWLFKENGGLSIAEQKEKEGFSLYLKALNYYLEIAVDPTVSDEGFRWINEDIIASNLVTDPHDSIEELIGLLEGPILPLSTMTLLFRYYERYGTFAKAEDMLFHMLNDYPEATDIKTSGLQFFERLLTREDGVLETGGLPRNEVEEGLEQLKASVRT